MTASSGALPFVPKCSTADASTICDAGSCANAVSAASSALLAPPARHEDSSTPDRRWPFRIDALGDVVIPPRGHETGILAHRLVIQLRLSHPGTDLGGHRQSIEGVPASAHANEIGATVNRSPVVILHSSLRPMVADREAIKRNMANA